MTYITETFQWDKQPVSDSWLVHKAVIVHLRPESFEKRVEFVVSRVVTRVGDAHCVKSQEPENRSNSLLFICNDSAS